MLLASCGGGGGGASDPGTAGPPAEEPSAGALAITVENAGRVTGYPLWATEAALRAGQMVVDDVVAIAGTGHSSDEVECQPNGKVSRAWQDKDFDGALSAGDVVVVTYRSCAREPLARSAQGSASVTIVSVDAAGGFKARLSIREPGIAFQPSIGETVDPDYYAFGSATLERGITPTRTSLALAASATDTLSFRISGDRYAPDRLSEFRLEKTLRWDKARSATSVQMRYTSDELGGNFGVSTPTPLLAWLDSLPEPSSQQGSFEMSGRNGDLVRVSVIGSGGVNEIAAVMDQHGDGSIEATGGGSWIDAGLISGYLFADTTPAGRGAVYAYDPTEFSVGSLPWPFGTTPVAAALALQFTRPPADTAWSWHLIDRGSIGSIVSAAADVPIQLDRSGALVTVRPQEPLRYSHRYEPVVQTGETVENRQRYTAVTGGQLRA